MLKYFNYDIVFQEIPDEVTLAVNITNCPNHCKGCHSQHLQQDIGKELDENCIDGLMNIYGEAITCFCFMGGDAAPHRVAELAAYIRQKYPALKTAWYSGCNKLPGNGFDVRVFNFIKIGSYIEEMGDLRSSTTNQRLYQIAPEGMMTDVSYWFRQH